VNRLNGRDRSGRRPVTCGICGQDAAVGPGGIDCVHCRPATVDERRAAVRAQMAAAKAERAAVAEAAAYLREEVGR
jgi:hypothetical protein